MSGVLSDRPTSTSGQLYFLDTGIENVSDLQFHYQSYDTNIMFWFDGDGFSVLEEGEVNSEPASKRIVLRRRAVDEGYGKYI